MAENPSALLGSWSSFYVMAGSSAAALTGLMFVVVTLVRERGAGNNPEGISTYSTPTVLHFATALLVCALLVAPWRSMTLPPVLVGVIGLYGVIYVVRVSYRASRLEAYRPDLEDWTWYTVLPFVGYAGMLSGAILLASSPAKALFAIAGSCVLLIFIGIRNAWDIVTFLAVHGRN